jgi:hypothetical protein
MHRIRGKLTYSNVMVTVLAVLVLGGGSAYAATHLGKESVGAKQLKKGAVTPAKLSKASKKKLTGAQGPIGPQGVPGKEGTPGKDGAQGPGAVTIEDTATATTRSLGTFAGVELADSCSAGSAHISLATPAKTSTLAEFGTVIEGANVEPRQGEAFSGQTVNGANIGTDLFLRDEATGAAFSRFDLHMNGFNCKLSGVITPSTR